ncbi:MAG: sodium:alanine symporter family protein, partial [Lachnospiraceae bacterium]|nr:sodium:alanine symporter family protein [Lachnospiraceae bacterium]
MKSIAFWLNQLNEIVWGPWMLALIVGTGIYLLVRMRFLPFRRFFHALRCAITPEALPHSGQRAAKGTSDHGKISPFASLTTELAATIGTGNIVGVATAMVLGGPGALVWMILSSFIGLSTKFAESMLSVKYRTKNADGQTVGGPMYTLQTAFPVKKIGRFLACLFAVFAVFASFGMGNMTQANSIATALKEGFGVSEGKTALFLSLLVILVILGGISSISKLNLYLVPFMALIYVAGGIIVLFLNAEQLPEGLSELFRMAFSKKAMAGGVGGSIVASMQDALRYGVSRGVFSNEAGLGAGGITAAAADTENPVRQGYISMTGVFFDTILM